MQRSRGVFALAAVLAVVLAATGAVGAQPHWYYETFFVGSGPVGFANEVAVMSAWTTWGGAPPPNPGWEWPMQAIFADLGTAAFPANAIHAAAMDSSFGNTIPNLFAPTGGLVVAKNVGQPPNTVNGMETYVGVPGSDLNPTGAGYVSTQELFSQPIPVSFATPTASGNPVQAMDIANGILPWPMVPFATDYIATAEVIANQIWIGIYGMTFQGVAVQPFFVNSTNTQTPAPCQGLTTSGGKAGWNPRTRCDIVFADGNNRVHAQWFEISAAAFPAGLDQNTRFQDINAQQGVQLPVPVLGSIAGIWVCQTPNIGNAHNVGVSFLGAGGAPNWMYVIHDVGSPNPGTGLFTTPVQGIGGGPITHIPTGFPINGRSPSAAILGPGAAITGWLLASPPVAAGTPWTLDPVDAYGVRPGIWSFPYTVNWMPNGTPLADPMNVGFAPAPPPNWGWISGLVWVPETDGQGNYQIHCAFTVAPLWAMAPFGHVISPGGNHAPLGPLPILPNTAWPSTQILTNAPTNSKSDYTLFMPGY